MAAHKHPAPSIGPAIFPADVPPARTPVSEGRYHGEQGMYLAASGTLIQFNAIIAALLTAALTMRAPAAVEAVIGAALLAHAVAGFLLCWAARPIANPDGTARVTAESMLLRAFINYRRGWRATMLALCVSVVALAGLAVRQLWPDLLGALP